MLFGGHPSLTSHTYRAGEPTHASVIFQVPPFYYTFSLTISECSTTPNTYYSDSFYDVIYEGGLAFFVTMRNRALKNLPIHVTSFMDSLLALVEVRTKVETTTYTKCY